MAMGQNDVGISTLTKQAFDDDEIFDETFTQIVMIGIPEFIFLFFHKWCDCYPVNLSTLGIFV